jgi:hypothetical protein
MIKQILINKKNKINLFYSITKLSHKAIQI